MKLNELNMDKDTLKKRLTVKNLFDYKIRHAASQVT